MGIFSANMVEPEITSPRLRSLIALVCATPLLTVGISTQVAGQSNVTKGDKATAAHYGTGSFRYTSSGKWNERSKDGSYYYEYLETGRDSSSVYLFDASRNLRLRLNFDSNMVAVSANGASYVDSFKMTSQGYLSNGRRPRPPASATISANNSQQGFRPPYQQGNQRAQPGYVGQNQNPPPPQQKKNGVRDFLLGVLGAPAAGTAVNNGQTPAYQPNPYPNQNPNTVYPPPQQGYPQNYNVAMEYIRFDVAADRADPGYPKYVDNINWPGVWTQRQIDSAYNAGNGKAYFFSGNEYVRFDLASDRVDPGYPKRIGNASWPGLWPNGIEAAFNAGNGKAYFFKGGQYIRFDIAADRADPGYPRPVDNNTWPGLPALGAIQSAVNVGNGKVYFFSGPNYLRYDIASDRADPGYPKRIDSATWPGVWSGGNIQAAMRSPANRMMFFRPR
jgi:hypothetical protein